MTPPCGRKEIIQSIATKRLKLDYIDFKTAVNEITGRVELSQIALTPLGLRFYTRRQSNEDVLFN